MSTQKMMLVPFNKQRPNRDIQQLEKLDNEMINIINNKHLSLTQKIDLYQEKLSKFIDKNKYLEIEQQLRPQFQTNDTAVNNKINEKQKESKNFSSNHDDDDDDFEEEEEEEEDYYKYKNREDTQYEYKYDDNSYSNNNILKFPNNKSFSEKQDDLIESFLQEADNKLKINKLNKRKTNDSIAQQLFFSPLRTREQRIKSGGKSPNELFSVQQRKKIFQKNKLLEEKNQSNDTNDDASTSAFQKLLTNNFTPQAPYKISQNFNSISKDQQSTEIGPNTEKWISMSRGVSRKSKNNDDLSKINEIRTPISLANLGINLKQSPSNV